MKISMFSLTLSLFLSACLTHGPTRVENDFGASVREMIEKQKYPSSASEPVNRSAVPTLNGEEAVKSIERHKQSAIKAKAVKRPLAN